MNDEFTPETQEEEEPMVYLVDENGEETAFRPLDIITYEEKDYAILFPADETDIDEEEDAGVVILRILPHEEDDGIEFEMPEEEDVLDAVFDLFMEKLRNAFDEYVLLDDDEDEDEDEEKEDGEDGEELPF